VAVARPVAAAVLGHSVQQTTRPIVSGAVFLTAIPMWALTVTSFAGPSLALDTPRGAWVAVYYWSFLAVLALACAIPHRAVTSSHTH
jgi:hypothetical protein